MLHCEDVAGAYIKIIYKADHGVHQSQYNILREEYKSFTKIQFIEESNFRSDVISSLTPFKYVLFLVDDNIFVRPFRFADGINHLENHSNCLGISLRLGENTTYCYSLNCNQGIPQYEFINNTFLEFDWTNAEADFGYPLEVSSSLYRLDDLLPIINSIAFRNPNAFEASLDQSKACFSNSRPR